MRKFEHFVCILLPFLLLFLVFCLVVLFFLAMSLYPQALKWYSPMWTNQIWALNRVRSTNQWFKETQWWRGSVGLGWFSVCFHRSIHAPEANASASHGCSRQCCRESRSLGFTFSNFLSRWTPPEAQHNSLDHISTVNHWMWMDHQTTRKPRLSTFRNRTNRTRASTNLFSLVDPTSTLSQQLHQNRMLDRIFTKPDSPVLTQQTLSSNQWQSTMTHT